MEKSFISNSKKETWGLVPEILDNVNDGNVILLKGELGSGKTTFSQGILNFLKAKGPFTSPTFVIMKKYDIKNKKYKVIYHLDCYRVVDKDVLALGWEEIISDKSNLILVEWPEKIEAILPDKYVQIEFRMLRGNKRGLEVLRN